MEKRKRKRCREPGCRSRQTFGSVAELMEHRIEAHGDEWPATKAKRRREAEARAKRRRTTPATPARPPMAKVTTAEVLARLPELVLADLSDSDLVREVANRLERRLERRRAS